MLNHVSEFSSEVNLDASEAYSIKSVLELVFKVVIVRPEQIKGDVKLERSPG